MAASEPRPSFAADTDLPSPTVRFPTDFVSRLGAFAVQLSATREREEVGRRRTLQGEGQEFVGHRPYRPGEDLRKLDWDLFARVDRPFVFVHRSEAREEWAIVLDTSASMGVGTPGKLQSAAESAAAAIAVGLHFGAHIKLAALDPSGRPAQVDVARTADLNRALAFLESLRASGEVGLEAFVGGDIAGGDIAGGDRAGKTPTGPRPPVAAGGATGAGRVLLFGDFLGVEVASVLRLLGGRRHVHLGQVLAPQEWDPGGAGSEPTAWVDAESGERRRSGGATGRSFDMYQRRLERFVEAWSGLAAGHAVTHRAWSSDEPFEAHLPDLLR